MSAHTGAATWIVPDSWSSRYAQVSNEYDWVSPEQLRDASSKLREAVRAAMPETEIILKGYERSATPFEPLATQFIRDLDDIITITRWADDEGATKITLEVNW